MNENQIQKVNSDSKFDIKSFPQNNYDFNEIYDDIDSDSSIFNLLNIETSDKTPGEDLSPYNSMTENTKFPEQKSHTASSAVYDGKSDTIDPQLEDLFLSKIPHVVIVDKPSIQYQILDPNYPSLTHSFKKCFGRPVLNLLVIVCNASKQVLFYQGYFSGLPRLSDELIDLKGMFWRSLVCNNDENVWDNHCRAVADRYNSVTECRPEFEVGSIIRCRLRASKSHQFNQHLNYLFVQPCSYLFHLPRTSQSSHGCNLNNVYMVSFINIMRECESETALKGSAAVTYQNLVSNPASSHDERTTINNDMSIPKPTNHSGQFSVNTSSQMFLNAPQLAYPLVHDQQYSRLRNQGQIQFTAHGQPITSIDNQYMSRAIDPHQHNYQTPYQIPQSTSTLQYILENRTSQYPVGNPKPGQNPVNQMLPHNNQTYQNICRSNIPCYIPPDHNVPSNCSLNSRHLVPMSSNGILLSTDQFFRNNPQINVLDTRQRVQPIMTMVRPVSSSEAQNTENYFFSTASTQQPPPQISLPYQNHLQSTGFPQYYSNDNNLNTISSQPYQMSHPYNAVAIKKETEDLNSTQNHWQPSQTINEYDGSRYRDNMTNDSISFDIVEEILEAEEAKIGNMPQAKSLANSDNSDSISYDIEYFGLLDNENNTRPTVTSNVTNTPLTIELDSGKMGQNKYDTEPSYYSHHLLNLKSETLEKFTTAQRNTLKNIVIQYKEGKLTKTQMLLKINDFIAQTFGKSNHYRNVIEFWKTQHHHVDSSLNNSHVIQSPEEGPGISPTEHAAQSTTDVDGRQISRQPLKTNNNDHIIRNRSSAKAIDASIYSISSTTSTGVLETLLNEHDHPIYSDKSYVNSSSGKVSVSSTFKQQLSLDQLLMDDECPMLAGFRDDKGCRNSDGNKMRQQSTNRKSTTSNMGVLESLLNQRNPSMSRIRQKSTESILKHLNPSRQYSFDQFQYDVNNKVETNEKENGSKNNSLLVSLLNNCNGNLSNEKSNTVNISNPSTVNSAHCASQPKRQKTISEFSGGKCDNDFNARQITDKRHTNDVDVFEFEDPDLMSNQIEECMPYFGALSQSLPSHNPGQRTRKRCYSRDLPQESDDSSDQDSMVDDCKVNNDANFDENIDLDDIKIDNFDLDNLIDLSESMVVGDTGVEEVLKRTRGSSSESRACELDKVSLVHSTQLVVNLSKSEAIIPISEPPVFRTSDKSTNYLSAIQAPVSLNSATAESLDNERERLLRQQQQQKLCLGGKYIPLNQLGATDQDSISYTLSLDSLSKQMKEVVPNVMVEQSVNNAQYGRSRSGSYSHPPSAMSASRATPIVMTTSGRLSDSDGQQSAPISALVHHRQVKDGLRQLVSNRSALIDPKNTGTGHRISAGSANDLVSPTSDVTLIRPNSLNMNLIHYHSDAHITSNTQAEPARLPYRSCVSNPADISSNEELKSVNILEDSLVNDVFELEELVKCNTSMPMSDHGNYRHDHLPRCATGQSSSPDNCDTTDMSTLPDHSRLPHHHHHNTHPHHHHPPPHYHHHHHLEATSHTDNDIATDNQNAPPSTGLLETLLSK